MSPSTPCQIRPATRADVPFVVAMVRELAEFEHLEHEMAATEEDFVSALFGPHPHAEVVIGCVEGERVGFALFFHSFSTFLGRTGIYLEDLYVRHEWRGRGYGKALLTHLARVAVERGCGRLEWSVLDWNQRAIDVYLALGARPMSEWTQMRLTGEALEKLGSQEAGKRRKPDRGAGCSPWRVGFLSFPALWLPVLPLFRHFLAVLAAWPRSARGNWQGDFGR